MPVLKCLNGQVVIDEKFLYAGETRDVSEQTAQAAVKQYGDRVQIMGDASPAVNEVSADLPDEPAFEVDKPASARRGRGQSRRG